MRLLLPHTCCFVLGSMIALMAAGCDHDHDGDGPHTEVGCAEDSRVEPYVVGSEKVGAQGHVLFRMGSLNPDPVDVGDNGWNLSLEEVATGNPLSGCTLEATPFMPDHNHGSNNPTATEGTTAGEYAFTDLSFIMAGYWEVTLVANCPDLDENDTVMVTFCIEG